CSIIQDLTPSTTVGFHTMILIGSSDMFFPTFFMIPFTSFIMTVYAFSHHRHHHHHHLLLINRAVIEFISPERYSKVCAKWTFFYPRLSKGMRLAHMWIARCNIRNFDMFQGVLSNDILLLHSDAMI
ncbi:hypothetical protein L9F63_021093, partial [Diploptera punctata]